ncbi:unnamed protein product, partial [Bemisia tabaci]
MMTRTYENEKPSPRRSGRHVTHISAYKTVRILHALRQTQCSQQPRGRRETHSAHKTVGILHALLQTQCGRRGAARRRKLKLLNH